MRRRTARNLGRDLPPSRFTANTCCAPCSGQKNMNSFHMHSPLRSVLAVLAAERKWAGKSIQSSRFNRGRTIPNLPLSVSRAACLVQA